MIASQDNLLPEDDGTSLLVLEHLGVRGDCSLCGRLDVASVVNHAELEGRGGAEDFLGARGVLDARELDDDAVGALALDKRLGDAELVDTVPDDVDVLVDSVGLELLETVLCDPCPDEELLSVSVRGENQIIVMGAQVVNRVIALLLGPEGSGDDLLIAERDAGVMDLLLLQFALDVLYVLLGGL